MASPYAAIYLPDNKRIGLLSSLVSAQWAAFEAGADDGVASATIVVTQRCLEVED